jgi:TatD DNase family protein
MFLVDSHCHLNLLQQVPEGDELDAIVQRALLANVKYLLNVCVDFADFNAILSTANAYPFVFASVGLHPDHEGKEPSIDELVAAASHDKVVAIGETGLDYYRVSGDLTWQRERFVRHIAAAMLVDKPLIIHTREAKQDTIALLRQEKAERVGGVMHCFTEDWDTALQCLELGFYISLSGIVTFKNAHTVQDVAKKVPLDRLLVETDAPYLAPQPHRGKTNEPAYVRHTAEFIAKLRGISFEEVQAATTENFFRLFKGATISHV